MTRATERRCRTTSPDTPTPKRGPKPPNRARCRPPGSTTWAWVADTHHRRVAADETINFDALYPQPDRHQPDTPRPDGQLPGQLSIDDILPGPVDPADTGEATA